MCARKTGGGLHLMQGHSGSFRLRGGTLVDEQAVNTLFILPQDDLATISQVRKLNPCLLSSQR